MRWIFPAPEPPVSSGWRVVCQSSQLTHGTPAVSTTGNESHTFTPLTLTMAVLTVNSRRAVRLVRSSTLSRCTQ